MEKDNGISIFNLHKRDYRHQIKYCNRAKGEQVVSKFKSNEKNPFFANIFENRHRDNHYPFSRFQNKALRHFNSFVDDCWFVD